MKSLITSISIFISLSAWAEDFRTNEITMHGAPDWVKRTKVEAATGRIQQKLEWRIRRIDMHWYKLPKDFQAAQNLGPQAIAVTRVTGGAAVVHMGPQVTETNYQQILAHELVHVIVIQKYKDAIPRWLEEGLANHLSKKAAVNYRWLATQTLPGDVDELAHPFKGSPDRIAFSYMASQALAEMLEQRCDFENLIRLSVQRKLEDYIRRTCEIPDINAAFKAWIRKKSAA